MSARCLEPVEARTLLDAFRYLLRGTRWRASDTQRTVSGAAAGYLVDHEGNALPLGRVRRQLTSALEHPDINYLERAAVAEFFGLHAYPADLTGSWGLAGSLLNHRGGAASRSTVSAAIKSGVAKMSEHLQRIETKSGLDVTRVRDPLNSNWLWSHPVWKALEHRPRWTLLEAAAYGALDLIDRTRARSELRFCIRSWIVKHGLVLDPGELAPLPIEQEQRNSAHAILDIAIWETLRTPEMVRRAIGREPVRTWVQTLPKRHPASALVSHRFGTVSAEDLDEDILVLLTGVVADRGDDDGRIADFLIPVLFGAENPHSDRSTVRLLRWAFMRGLAAKGDWRAVEVANALADLDPDSSDLIDGAVWAGHVASLHHHQELADRFLAWAERLVDAQAREGKLEDAVQAGKSRMLHLVRSGSNVRAADGLRSTNAARGLRLLETAEDHLHRAAVADQRLEELTGRSDPSVMLRATEILIVAHRYRSERRVDQRRELERASQQLADFRQRLERVFDEADDDQAIYRDRVELLVAAISAELDDSPVRLW